MVRKAFFAFLVVVFFCFVFSVPSVHGQNEDLNCPRSAGDVQAAVSAEVQFLPDTNAFVYRYTVTNSPSSPMEVDAWAVRFSSLPSAPNDSLHDVKLRSPKDWFGSVMGGGSRVRWNTIGPHKDVDVGGGIAPEISQIKPGNSQGGFGFTSQDPPGLQAAWVSGFVQLPTAQSENEAEAIALQCPDESVGPWLQRARKISTNGPSLDLRAEIDIKPGSDPNAVNLNSQGVIPVALLGSDDFSVQKASDTQALFGITMTEPVRPGEIEDVNNDGHDDLVFHFPIPETGITKETNKAALSVALTEPIRRCRQPRIETTERSGIPSRKWQAGTLKNLRALKASDGPPTIQPAGGGPIRRDPCEVVWGTDTLKVVGPGSGGGQGPPGNNNGKGGPKSRGKP